MDRIELLQALISHLTDLNEDDLRQAAIDIGWLCNACRNKGYLEVTCEDGEYIQACDDCNWYSIRDDRDDLARVSAEADGYKLDSNGKIK